MKKLLIIVLLFPLLVSAQKQKPDTVPAATPKPAAPQYYYNIGDLRIWQMLFKLCTTPKKLTGEQTDSVLLWVTRIQPVTIDTTKPKPAPTPKRPTARIGRNTMQMLRVRGNASILKLDGSKSYDPDGYITKYRWRVLPGSPNPAYISEPDSAITTAAPSEWIEGIYSFELTVTDNDGGTGKDTMTVTIVGAVNMPPSVDAGADKEIRLPASSVDMTATALDIDGRIASINWRLTAQPNGSSPAIRNPSITTATVYNLKVAGQYTAYIEVADDKGAKKSATLKITVRSSCSFWDKLFHLNGGCRF